MKKLLTTILSATLALGMCLGFVGCSEGQLTQAEYEAAFSNETLSNVTIATTGPYWERDHIKEYYYRVGDSFAFCSYHDDMQYYGKFYEVKNGEEAYYLFGSEKFEHFNEDDAVWRKSEIMLDDDSYFRNAEFVALYRKDFHLLKYDTREKYYFFEFTAQERPIKYSYYFAEEKLIKFEITSTSDKNYHYVWEFYDYGTTQIPVEIVT